MADITDQYGNPVNSDAQREANALLAEYNALLEETQSKGAEINELAAKRLLFGKTEEDISKAITKGKDQQRKIESQIEKLNESIGKAQGEQKEELEKIKKQLLEQKGAIGKNIDTLKEQGKVLKTFNKIGKAAFDGFINAALEANKIVSSTGRNLGLSRDEVLNLKASYFEAGQAANDLNVTSLKLLEANNELNEQLGTAIKFSAETAGTFSKLTKVTGLSADAAGNLAFAAEASGKNFREQNEDILEASYALQRTAGINLNNKKILEATGKVTGQLRANFAANPKAIAEAVTKAKLLGAEITDIANAGKQLLEFETSIGSELEAELLTGKQLNLERARAAALAGDQATLADELAKNMGSFSEFSDMNVLQQDALAKSMGMTSDQLSDMLFKQETMGMNAEELRAIGKDELANQLEQQSLEEKRAAAQEKFSDAMASLAPYIESIANGIGNMVEGLITMAPILNGIVAAAGAYAVIQAGIIIKQTYINAKKRIAAALEAREAGASIFSTFAKIPFGIGIPLAIGAIAALYSALNKSGEEAKKMAYGGIVKPRPGGTPAIIGEAGQPEAVVPLNKAKQMGFGGGGGSNQPIIINNTWDAFAASNSRGRRGLGGTQELQASPTFV